jgi:hypothetical protein
MMKMSLANFYWTITVVPFCNYDELEGVTVSFLRSLLAMTVYTTTVSKELNTLSLGFNWIYTELRVELPWELSMPKLTEPEDAEGWTFIIYMFMLFPVTVKLSLVISYPANLLPASVILFITTFESFLVAGFCKLILRMLSVA